ncbi:indoleacetamide hydrolase [Pseudothauera rhizosphaerae]|uniref:Indoleacetamide hydrolase n=1 Tax=Pseudothauera rhizosphaerae TaxID=2565932 RepID=A0A4V3WB87_9RHOO|nr:indoleacetamide hydrolase [Pseudothauera rhizosphaerae]THF62146.1 indoleacetamide hydrolase [Pseudothauera rhizosphaerae]
MNPHRSTSGPTLAEAAAQIAAGELSCGALMRDCIARAEAHPELNIFITLDAERALAAACAADAARAAGQAQGPLAGLPIVVKDNIHAAGLPATAGTPALADFVPRSDAPTLRRLREAGAVVLGKTNMHELAFGATGYNHAFHHPGSVGVRNPYDATRIAGGSSSGSAAALGARMALASLGTDTGGSMRIPCALNGCASLRPSWGRYSGEGVIPISNSRDTVGPMALCMADVALLDGIVTGEAALHSVRLDTLRLGVAPGFWANLDEDTQALTAAAVKKLEAVGVSFIEVPEARLLELNEPIGFPVVLYEAYDDMVAWLRDQGPGISIEALFDGIASPDVKGIYGEFVLERRTFGPGGKPVPARPLYDEAVRHGRPALKAHYRELFARHRLDAFVFPTTPVVAPVARPEISLPENFHLLIQNTEPSASAGLPSIQLPIGLGPATGLPVGMELDGPDGTDRRLLSVGMALEAVLGRIPSAM